MSNAQEVKVNVQRDSTVAVDDTLANYHIVPPALAVRQLNPYQGNVNFTEVQGGSALTVSPNFFDRNAVMPRIANLGGYVASASLPGLMGIETGALSYSLSAEKFTFTPAVYVNKYGYFGGLTTSVGAGAQIDFTINDRFSVTAFGAYHTNSWAANQAVMSNMMSSRFGGYGTWNINDSWSLSAGAQRVYNAATNQWQTVPIVMPTFKINGKAAFSLDVGGLLYQIVDYSRNKSSYQHRNPTIGPPIKPQIEFKPYTPW